MNAVVQAYKKYLADTGQQDDSTDYDITRALGEWAQQSKPELFDAYPDFAEQFGQIRDANAPSLGGELVRGLKQGTKGLASTGLGGLGLLTDIDWLKQKAADVEKSAQADAPTIPTLEDIAPGRHGIGALFSRDAARYGLSKLGSVAPSIAEGIAAAGIGGLAGTAAAPGPGTVAGAAEGLVARNLIKSAIRSMVKKGIAEELVAKGVISEASEAALEQAVKAGVKGLADKVSTEAMAIGAKRGLAATNLANSFLLNAGDVASEGADRPTTMALGFVSALPDSILPGYVVSRLFPGVSASKALPLAKQFVGDRAMKALEAAGVVGVEAGTEYFQEAVNVVARNLKEGKDAMDFTPADLRRFREAGIAGGVGGGLAAPSIFISPKETTTADVPPGTPPPAPTVPPPAPTVPPPKRFAGPVVNPLAGLMEAPPATEGVTTPFDTTRNEIVGGLLTQQQDEIARQTAEAANRKQLVDSGIFTAEEVAAMSADEVHAALQQMMNTPPAERTALGMVGETPEVAAERLAKQRAYGMAGGLVPDASSQQQADQRAAEAMAGNVPPELGEPVVPSAPIPENNILPAPASGATQEAIPERAEYERLQALMSAMIKAGQGGSPEFNAVWQQSEDIKNRNNGMPPGEVAGEEVPPPVSPVVEQPAPAPVIPPPAAAPVAPVAPEAVPAVQEKDGYRLIGTFKNKKEAQAAMKPGKNYRLGKSADGKTELWFKPKGKQFSVGMHPSGEMDILNHIEELGGIQSRSAAANPGGEYDGQGEAFRGRARLLLRKSASKPDDLAAQLHEIGVLGSSDTNALYDAVEKAVAAREKARKDFGTQEFDARFDAAFLSDDKPKKWLRAGQPISIDDLNVGETFEVNGEKFTVVKIDEEGNVTIKDGVTRVIPPGTSVFPDQGKVKKRKGSALSDWDKEMAKEAPAAPVAPVTPPPVAPVPDAVAPKPAAPVTEKPFQFGPVVESVPTMDFRTVPDAANLTPEQWVQAVQANMAQGVRASRESSKADTRIGVALQSPDGRVILTGVTLPDRTLNSVGQNILKEPTLQRMGVTQGDKRVVTPSGNKPALLSDVIRAGYKPLAILHFDTDAGRIHEVFADQKAFDAAWGASPKTSGRNIQPTELRAAVPRAQREEERLQKEIEKKGDELLRAKPEERPAIIDEIRRLYAELDRITRQNQDMSGDVHPPEYRQDSQSSTAIQAAKHGTFQRVISNLQQLGMKVDVFSREILAQSTATELQRRITVLQEQAAASPDPVVRAELMRRIGVLNERMQAVQQAAGVTYTPWHIALAADDIGQASTNNLVTLLHEAAEALTMRLPIQQRGAVQTAIDKAMTSLRERATAAAAQTGVALARETSPTDLLAETMAQEMTAAGIPDSPSLAQAIIRWVKDAYYRTAMALQAAFGAEPSADMALDWYENQLRREVLGDYSYEFGNLLDRYLPSPLKERVRRFDGRRDTPGGIPDFLDPVSGIVRQPQVETLNRDALNWNMEFQLPGHPGAELEIADPEARARIKGGVLNGLAEFYESLRQQIAPEMDWNEFFGEIKRTAEEDPKLLIADLNSRIAGSGDAKIGGERMTDPMNREAQVELWGRFRKLGLALRRKHAQAQQSVAEASKQFSEVAKDVNKLEGDLRNAALHEDRLKARAKELVKELAQAITRGRSTAHKQGMLAEAIRQEENLMEEDPIPDNYRAVLQSLSDGTTPIFDYIRAIAELDLPLTEMTNREVLQAIKGGADHNETLARLTANKPLAVALATLARSNAEQVDQIQLGWLRDTSLFREIHAQLEEIKAASSEKLKELAKQIDQRGKAAGLAARIKASYVQKRRKQQAASDRIARGEARMGLIEKAIGPVEKATDDMAQAAGGAQVEWAPEEGAIWTAMKQDDEGNWHRTTRVLRFNPDGSAINGEQLRQDIAANVAWLADRRSEEGKPRYNQIAAQTYALKLLDARRQQQRTWNSGILNAVDRFVRTPIASARSLGGPAMQRVIQMLNRYQFILRNYAKELDVPAMEWQHEFTRLRNASGIKDNGEFIDQVYKPAMFFLSVNPGLDDGPAIRQATALVRRSLRNPGEDFNERFAAFIRKTKDVEQKLLKIAEQYGVFVEDKRLGDFFRRAVPRGYLTGMRSLNGGLVDVLTKDMQKAGWKLSFRNEVKDGKVVKTHPRAATFDAIDPRNAEDEQQSEDMWATLANADALRPLLARLFTPSIIGQWLEPFIRKPGQEPFSYENEAIPQSLVGEAWSQSGGDVLNWIDRLGQMLEVDATPDENGVSDATRFRLAMFRNLDQLFGHEAKLAYDASQTPGLLDPHGAKPHAMMDARVSDLLPPEHVTFSTYEPESMHRLLAQVAYHGAFGRNARNIQAAFRENMNHLKGKAAEYQAIASLHTSTAGRVAEAAARGWNYDELKTAAKRYDELRDFQSQLEAVLGVSANSGPLGDFHKAMSVMNFVVGQIVDNPKTAAYNVISPAMRPFAQRSLGPTTIANTARVYADILHTGLGSLFQSFGLHLLKAGRYADTIGNAEGRAFGNLPTSVVLSDIGHSGDNQSGLNKWMVKPLKIARNLQRKGLQVGAGEAAEFPRLALIPGLGVINSISNIEVQAGGAALAREFEQLVKDGIDYMAKHPDAADNLSFQFKPSDLYKWKLDHNLLDWWKQKTVEYGLGTFEDVVRDAAKRQAADPTQRLLTDDQALTLTMMNQNEFSGNSSINTTPGWLMTNPFLRMTMPLLRWPLWMMSAVHEAAKPRAGENSVKPMLRALGTLALWNLPIGIAFSMLMDEYDKKIAGKKSNLPNIQGVSALPLVGLPLGLLTADKPMTELESMLVRAARAGNIYGLGADVAAQTMVGLDPSTGQRSVSFDQRVLVMSQLTNMWNALNAYRNQGYANWGSVARPLLMSIGGNGVLHSVDITNNLLGLDNAQSRLVQRASSSNWIRAAAQELDMDIRKGAGSAPPTPMSAHTREMYLAALANDRADFLEQYRLALNAAREAVADDPNIAGPDREKEARNRVLASWGARNPFSVLAAKPTDAQIQRLLSIMDPVGQQTVRETMERYKTFTEMITPSPVERYFQRRMSVMQSQMTPEALRRRMTGGMLFLTR